MGCSVSGGERRRGRRLTAGQPIARHRRVVLAHRRGEGVSAVVASDEVEVLDRRRDRAPPRWPAGPGSRSDPAAGPRRTYVLYGWSVSRSARVSVRRSLATAYCTVGSACSGMSRCSRFQNTAEISRRSSGSTASRSMIEASVSSSWASSPQGLGPGQALRRQPAARALHHPAQHLLDGHAAHELVGVREEVALQARSLDAERLEDRRVVGHPHDVLGRAPGARTRGPGPAPRWWPPRGAARCAGARGRSRASSTTSMVEASRGTSYSPALRRRTLPRAALRARKAARLRTTPASARRSAMPSRPSWAGMSTTSGPASSGGRGGQDEPDQEADARQRDQTGDYQTPQPDHISSLPRVGPSALAPEGWGAGIG